MAAGQQPASERRRERIQALSRQLTAAQQPIRVLRTLGWPEDVQRIFFETGAREPPKVRYRIGNAVPQAIAELDALVSSADRKDPAEDWIARAAQSFADAGRMLLTVGTKDFYEWSKRVYGHPDEATHDPNVTNLDLARHVAQFVGGYRNSELGKIEDPEVSASEAAARLEGRFRRFFGASAPRVQVVSNLSARAVAGADTVRLNAQSRFSEAELTRLEHHEGYVHVATTLNGMRQPNLSALGLATPRATTQQEGLATFAELQSQALDLDRLEILADRIMGIKMSADGADFVDLYVYFLDHTDRPYEAFEAARRVVRGGLTTGGAPFTKDVCYLEGLLLIFNFIQAALARHHPEYVQFLFVGKVHTDDLPLLVHLHADGLIERPVFLPRWARDLRFLAAHMGFSSFLNRTDASAWVSYCDRLVEAAGPVPAVTEASGR